MSMQLWTCAALSLCTAPCCVSGALSFITKQTFHVASEVYCKLTSLLSIMSQALFKGTPTVSSQARPPSAQSPGPCFALSGSVCAAHLARVCGTRAYVLGVSKPVVEHSRYIASLGLQLVDLGVSAVLRCPYCTTQIFSLGSAA